MKGENVTLQLRIVPGIRRNRPSKSYKDRPAEMAGARGEDGRDGTS